MASLFAQGAATLGQDEATSVVYGMPRAAFEAGSVQKQLPVTQIGAAVNDAVLSWRRSKHKMMHS